MSHLLPEQKKGISKSIYTQLLSFGFCCTMVSHTDGAETSNGDYHDGETMSQGQSVVTLQSRKDTSTRLHRWLTPHGSFPASLVSRCCFSTLIFAMLLFAAPSSAQECTSASPAFASGDGSEGTPYQITNVCQLQGMNSSPSAHYELVAAVIEAGNTANWDGGKGFVPIGSATTPFTGTFNGDGNMISNLFINRPDESVVGLFGKLGIGGEIQGVDLQDVRVTGQDRVGSLVGYSVGSISNSDVLSGTVVGHHEIGGLVGKVENGSLSVCKSAATVQLTAAATGKDEERYIGGLVGRMSTATISRCSATGELSLAPGQVRRILDTIQSVAGGLVGFAENVTVTNSFATGQVNARTHIAGGLIGWAKTASMVTKSYAAGKVMALEIAGGLVGLLDENSSVKDCYATGNVKELMGEHIQLARNMEAGGLVGWLQQGGSIDTSYATGDVTSEEGEPANLVGLALGPGVLLVKNSFTTGKRKKFVGPFGRVHVGEGNYSVTTPIARTGVVRVSLAQLTCPTTPGTVCDGLAPFINWDASVWDFGTNQVLPTLPSCSQDDSKFTLGDGSGGDPYLITGLCQLQGMNSSPSAHYKLAAAIIDASSTFDWNGGNGFVPIGSASTPFLGTFNGGGNVIRNLFIKRPGESAVGLFGVAVGGTIRNVVLQNARVTGQDRVGGLVGGSQGGTVSDSSASGAVTGESDVGGLVGHSQSGTVSDSSASGTVTGKTDVGGLVGDSRGGTVSDSSASGAVKGESDVGGLAGRIEDSMVRVSYATGNVDATENAGGLAGFLDDGAIVRNSYATGNVVAGDTDRGYAGGLAGRIEDSMVRVSYATGQVEGRYAGGLAGLVHSRSTIADSFATGGARRINPESGGRGGLVGRPRNLTSTRNYSVSDPENLPGTTLVMLGQLTCPTTPGTVCEGLAPFNNWDASVWDFGSNIQLPQLRELPNPDREPLAQIDIGISATVIGFAVEGSTIRTAARIMLSPPPEVTGVLEVRLTRISGVDVCSEITIDNCLFLRINGMESNEIEVSAGSRSFSLVLTLRIRGEIVSSEEDGMVELDIRLQGFGSAGSKNKVTLNTRLGGAMIDNTPVITDSTLRVRVLLGGATR